MQLCLAELLQRFDGLGYHVRLLAQGKSSTNGPILNCNRHPGMANHHTYPCTPVPSPPGGQLILTKHKSDHATPFWKTQRPCGQTKTFKAMSSSPTVPRTGLPNCPPSRLQECSHSTSWGSALDFRLCKVVTSSPSPIPHSHLSRSRLMLAK